MEWLLIKRSLFLNKIYYYLFLILLCWQLFLFLLEVFCKVECKATSKGIKYIASEGIEDLGIRSESLQAIQAVLILESAPRSLRNILYDCILCSNLFKVAKWGAFLFIYLFHLHRESNKHAHAHARVSKVDFYFWFDGPSCDRHLLHILWSNYFLHR